MIHPTQNLEALLERTKQEWLAEQIDNLPKYETAEDRLQAVKAIVTEVYDRDSSQSAALRPLGPQTLVGLYFRAPDQYDTSAESAWLDGEPCKTVEGIVVGQPFTSSTDAIYRVEFYGEHGASGHQELVDLDRMTAQRWAFYDSDHFLANGKRIPVPAEATAVPNDGEA